MKNTLRTIPVPAFNRCERKLCVVPIITIVLLFLLFLPTMIFAQSNCITNNTINCKPPVCDGSKAYFEGSQARASNGDRAVTYQWQINTHDNSPNGYVDIPGATSEDYSVPASFDGKGWFRRVAIYGNCRVVSDRLSIANCANQQIQLPTARVVQPTCASPTGYIDIIEPETAVSFSIDGVNYVSTTLFENLPPKTYSISVKYVGGTTRCG